MSEHQPNPHAIIGLHVSTDYGGAIVEDWLGRDFYLLRMEFRDARRLMHVSQLACYELHPPPTAPPSEQCAVPMRRVDD